MKNWLFVLCAVFLLAGCAKYTTPRKVKKRLAEGTWTIKTFTIEGESVVENYSSYKFSFGEGGGISVKNSSGSFASGSWELGLAKNPAILYLSFPPVGGLEYLADDWQVVEMQKSTMRLKRNDSAGSSSTVIFKK